MKRLFAFLAGLLFGIGLIVSGMTDANKVIGFLDVADAWDPTLAFVMVGGIAAHLALFKWITAREKPWYDTRFFLPTLKDVNAKLVGGAALFGIGWGLSGYCPGPALVSVASGAKEPLVLVASMIVGMLLKELLVREKATS